MKRSLLIGCLLLSACITGYVKQRRAEILVRHYLDSTLNGPNQYKDIKFDKIDTLRAYKLSADNKLIRIRTKPIAGRFMIECTYTVKGVKHKTVFEIDSALTKIDTTVE